MNADVNAGDALPRLPAQRIDASGRAQVDLRSVLALALPLFWANAIQTILGLTDIWFAGRLSTQAVAAVGAVHWIGLVVVLILSGVGAVVQTVAAQAHGSRRHARASRSVWIALWGVLCTAPIFFAVALSGHWVLRPFALDPGIEKLALEFWFPRLAGGPLGVAVWAMQGFFNGIGRPRLSVAISVPIVLINIGLGQLFIFKFGWGVAGAAWATNVAQAVGLALALAIFLQTQYRREYRSHLTWRPNAALLWRQLKLGFAMDLLYAADLLALSIFQFMQVRLGAANGAASQIVLILDSVVYLPGFGIALAGTTLVGQAIGAGDRNWALTLGTRVILLNACVMGGLALMIAIMGPWLLPLFIGAHDAQAATVVELGTRLLWISVVYQVFEALNLGAGLCLRGAGDAKVPALLVALLTWFLFIPLAHALTFAPGEGWFDLLPQAGWGLVGGWTAVAVYLAVLGTLLFIRWRSMAWRHIRI